MHMQLSTDGRDSHGKSITDGYVFIEVEVADWLHQRWVDTHLRTPENLKITMQALHASANFWDLALLEGTHTIQLYMLVEFLQPHHYRVNCTDHGQLFWDYAFQDIHL